MQERHTDHGARIHVDQEPYESPTPTTGAALYVLAKIHDGYDLFREVEGNREDERIPKDDAALHLKQDEHFYSGKAHERVFKIIVNTEPKEVKQRVLTFNQVTELAFPGLPTGPNIVFTVTYKKAVAPMHQGSLLPGGTVKIKNGTIFSVTRTDKS